MVMCASTVLANIEGMSGSQLTPSVAVYSQRNKELEKLLHFRDLFGWRWDRGKASGSLGITL